MALIREKSTIVTKEEVIATTGKIRQFTVNINLKKIIIEIEWGNEVDGKFTPCNHVETFTISNDDYMALAAGMPDGNISIHDNISKMLWNKLKELGFVEGSIAWQT